MKLKIYVNRVSQPSRAIVIFYKSTLRSFKRRVAYANANYDYMVGWRTSSIRRQRELPQPHLLVNYEKYPHIVYVERGNAVDIHTEASSLVKVKTFDLEGVWLVD